MGLNYFDLFIALYMNSNLASTVNLISVIFLNYKVIFFNKNFYLGVTVTNGDEQLEGKVTIFTALLQGTNNQKKKKMMNWEILEQRKTLKQ